MSLLDEVTVNFPQVAAVANPFQRWDLEARREDQDVGRLVFADRGPYSHVGLAIGDGTVIHFSGEILAAGDTNIVRTTEAVFAKDGDLRYVDPEPRLNPHLSCLLALAHVGRAGGRYDPLVNNCEAVAFYCATGMWISDQVLAGLRTVLPDADSVIPQAGNLWPDLTHLASELAAIGLRRTSVTSEAPADGERRETGGNLPFYYGQLYRGKSNYFHTRVQAACDGLDRDDRTSASAWLDGPPWDSAAIASKPIHSIAAVGFLSLDDDHRAKVTELCTRFDFARILGGGGHPLRYGTMGWLRGPWMEAPCVHPALALLAHFVKEPVESTLNLMGDLWVDDSLNVFLQSGDEWAWAGELPWRALPGATLSPILNPIELPN